MEDFTDLYTLQRQVKEGLGELFPDRIWVCAEIAALQVRNNGHCYLDLVQSENGVQKAKAKAIIWAGKYPMLSRFYRETTGSSMQAGQQVQVLVQVNYSELYGLSLIIDDINPEYTLGDAEKQKKITVERLTREGLLERQARLELCRLPYRLAVVSARDAAGYGDFCRHLEAGGYAFDVVLVEAAMQGIDAPASICRALALVDGCTLNGSAQNDDTGECLEGPFDAVLILRGGGSALDLACYDDYSLCAAIALCPVPVFTAVGHDKDYHVADMVAYMSVKTPTALADVFIGFCEEENSLINQMGARLKRAFAARLAAEEYHIRMLALRVRQSCAGKIALQEALLQRYESRIVSSDPRKLLERGYTLVTDAAGTVLKSVVGLRKGDSIRVMMSDGTVRATID